MAGDFCPHLEEIGLLNTLLATPIGLPLACLLLAIVIIAPGYMTTYMNGVAAPAAEPKRFPFRSALRAVLILFIATFGSAAGVRYAIGLGRWVDIAWALGAISLLIFIWKLPPDDDTAS